MAEKIVINENELLIINLIIIAQVADYLAKPS